MALDKSRTSLGVKVVLIFVALAMVGYLVPTLFGLFGSNPSPSDDPSSGDATAAIAQKYTARVAANDAALQSDPTSYTVLVDQGNAYFDWGLDVQQAAGTNEALRGAAQPLWLAARQFYERATAINTENPAVGVDLAIAYFYSGETTKAIATAEVVRAAQPDFAPAWFNLGVFYEGSGDGQAAIPAYEEAIRLDPEGQSINLQYAQQQLQTLKAAGGTGGSAITTTP